MQKKKQKKNNWCLLFMNVLSLGGMDMLNDESDSKSRDGVMLNFPNACLTAELNMA